MQNAFLEFLMSIFVIRRKFATFWLKQIKYLKLDQIWLPKVKNSNFVTLIIDPIFKAYFWNFFHQNNFQRIVRQAQVQTSFYFFKKLSNFAFENWKISKRRLQVKPKILWSYKSRFDLISPSATIYQKTQSHSGHI